MIFRRFLTHGALLTICSALLLLSVESALGQWSIPDELQAQAKIQTLRLRLFARVRSFDDATETWSMRVITLPNSTNDWWHTRLHFISKD